MNRFFTLLLAASCLTAVGQYEVGDVGPAGGWIFYVDSLDEFDWDYLEVASFSGQAPNWGGYFQCSDNIEQSLEVGRGEWNTAYCLGEASPYVIADLSTGGPGALVEAVGHTQGGYADWYLPSVGELELLYSAFGDSIADMIDISDYCSPGLRFWTSSFTVTNVYVNSCQHRGVTITLGGGTSSQETTGNQWGSGCGKVHGVLPIRSFSKSIQDACGVGTVWDELTQTCIVDESACGWQPDGNGDNLIGVNDLLDLLGVYGDTDYDQDGIWDSADDCVGEYDECGVCNGSGPSIPIIESIEILYDSVYAEPIDEWFVFEIGADTTFSFTCAPSFSECGDPVSYQGYAYETVQIGEQCWFAENLRSEAYANGDMIQSAGSAEEFAQLSEGAKVAYGEWEDTCSHEEELFDACNPSEALEAYGYLYNWHATSDDKGICPSGWSVPSQEDWGGLFNHFGGNAVAGEAMKTSEGWAFDGGGSNVAGFDAVPGSQRNTANATWESAGAYGFWWSSTSTSPDEAWGFKVSCFVDNVYDSVTPKSVARSIRCIQDSD